MTTINSLGIQPGIVGVVVFFVAFLIAAVVLWRKWSKSRQDSDDEFAYGIGGIISSVGTVVTAFALILSLVPFNAKYYDLYSVSGTISEVSNTFESGSGNSTTATFVVTFDGDNRPYVLTDPRIVSLDGSEVELLCTSSWVYQAADKWNCEIRDAGY